MLQFACLREGQVRDEVAKKDASIALLNQEIVRMKDRLSKSARDIERAKQSSSLKFASGNASERESTLQKEISKYSVRLVLWSYDDCSDEKKLC